MRLNREQVLLQLLTYDRPLSEIESNLSTLGWDSEKPVVVLKLSQISSIMERALCKSLSLEKVSRWAELIESREDIAYEATSSKRIKEYIYNLANPDLSGSLTLEYLSQILTYCRNTM